MIIDNKKECINFKLLRFLFLFLLSLAIILLYNLKIFNEPFLGIDRTTYVVGLTGIYIIYYLTGIIRNYNYIFFTDNSSKIIIRYYSLRPLSKKQKAIEIMKEAFADFKISKQLFGFRIKLVIYQRMPDGSIAKYPPVNITFLRKYQINQIRTSLKSYKKV